MTAIMDSARGLCLALAAGSAYEEGVRTITPAARGASEYTQPDRSPTWPLDDRGLLAPDRCSGQTQTWTQLIDTLRALRDLEDDWDGQGAEAPHPALVDGAITLARQFQTN